MHIKNTKQMKKFLIISILLFTKSFLFAQDNKLLTFYELSGFKETPKYEQTIAYCKLLEQNSSFVKYTTFGKSPQGRDLPLLIVDKNKNFTTDAIKKSGNAVLLIQACIHAGESEGKDAGFTLLRDIITDKKMEALLNHVTILFIPIFNVDGHERFSKYNRINQNGPIEMGWRTTANNLNLNRDYVKADAPEMREWIRMFNDYNPDFFVDCHTTDGADYQYAVTYGMEVEGNVDANIAKWEKDIYLKQLIPEMFKLKYPILPYVMFRNWHDPRSGLYISATPPMLSQGYTIARNRPGLLIETHMLKDYKTRVSATYKILENTISLLNKEYLNLHNLIEKADKYTASPDFRKQEYNLGYTVSTTDSTMVNFLGVEYTEEKSDLTGGSWFKYSKVPTTFSIPLFDKLKPTMKVQLPEAYIIGKEWTKVIELLDLHNISYKELSEPLTVKVQSYKFDNIKWQQNSYEGRHAMSDFDLIKTEETRTYPAGSVLVDMNQPMAKIIVTLFEPKASGSLVYWGFFDAVCEQKEYVESYVMEPLARKMLAEDAQLRKEFDAKMAMDSVFANDQRAILNWFYSKSPWWDANVNRYPVGRIMDREAVLKAKKIRMTINPTF